MDSSRALELLQSGAESNYFGTRVMAIELLGRLGHTGSKALIVRGLAEAQGGSVVLQEAPDGGARVRISLPAGQED